jgi:hypothetical protein
MSKNYFVLIFRKLLKKQIIIFNIIILCNIFFYIYCLKLYELINMNYEL